MVHVCMYWYVCGISLCSAVQCSAVRGLAGRGERGRMGAWAFVRLSVSSQGSHVCHHIACARSVRVRAFLFECACMQVHMV